MQDHLAPTPPSDAEVQRFFDRANTLAGTEAALTLYADWAGSYDCTIERFGRYLSPGRIAGIVARCCANRAARVLDLACGTGLVGVALAAEGFGRVIGLDLSSAMLEEAARKRCYASLIAADVTALPDLGRHDVVVCCGALTVGHLGLSAFETMAGLLAPGGLLVVDIEGGTFAAQGFTEALERMLAGGRLVQVTREEGHFYAPTPNEPFHGWFVTARGG